MLLFPSSAELYAIELARCQEAAQSFLKCSWQPGIICPSVKLGQVHLGRHCSEALFEDSLHDEQAAAKAQAEAARRKEEEMSRRRSRLQASMSEVSTGCYRFVGIGLSMSAF